MTDQTAFGAFEQEVQAVMNVPQARTEFILQLKERLHQQALQALPTGPVRRRPFVLQRGWAVAVIILMLLAITVLAVGPQRVLAAVRGLLGYIPGVGILEEGSSLQILAEPAEAEREGITLQVTEGAADSLHTILVYQADNLSLEAANSQGEGAITGGLALLILPDGSILTQTGMEMKGWGTGYETRLVFPPLPEGVNECTLVIERLDTMPPGAAPEDWRISLIFKPAPPDFEMLPVYELSPSSETPAAKDTVVFPSAGQDEEAPYGIHLVLDRVIETENGFLLQGHTSWDGQDFSSAGFDAWLGDSITLTDGLGNAIPFEQVNPDYSLTTVSTTSAIWALETDNKSYPGPWILSVNSMQVYRGVEDPSAVFDIDFGDAPQYGQIWQLNQSVQTAGFSLRAVSASLRQDDRSGSPVLEILMENDPDVTGVGLEDALNLPKEGQTAGAGGGPQEMAPGQMSTLIAYYELPAGLHSLTVKSISYNLHADWRVSWLPPEAVSATSVTGQPDTACLTDEIWQQLRTQAGTLLEGLSGRVLLEQYTGYLMPQLSLVNLDGSDRQKLVFGGWGSLSPDGKTAAYIESDGPALLLLDTATLQSRQLPGSVAEDYSAHWSADGQWLAFVRSNNGIYVSRIDGSDMRKVADNSKIRFLAGWLPDNRLVISSLGPEGSQVQVLDLETNNIEDMFVIENIKGGFIQLSQDGTRLAFAQQIFGEPAYGIYVSNLDGTDKRLVSSITGGVTATAWSPDGQWLALSVEVDGGITREAVLAQPNTCRVIRLPELEGSIIGWVK